METIKAYIEQMFKELPMTKEVVEMKLNIQDHMEDKFQSLVESGMSETEAAREVIYEFGDIEEIKKELNITNIEADELVYLNEEEITKYMEWKHRLGRMISIGVAICVNAVGIFVLLANLLSNGFSNGGAFIPKEFSDAIIIFIFFAMIAIAVVIFIFFGTKDEAYEAMIKNKVLNRQKEKEIKQKHNDLKVRSAGFIALGVVICLMAVATCVALESLLDNGIGVFTMFIMISIATAVFIHFGVKIEAYELLLKNTKRVTEGKKEKDTSYIYGVIMMSATILFFILGFGFQVWHVAWIVFPIGGILCGIVASIVERDK